MDHLVVAGSYEGGLHGWQAAPDATSELSLRFSFGAHGGCCKEQRQHLINRCDCAASARVEEMNRLVQF